MPSKDLQVTCPKGALSAGRTWRAGQVSRDAMHASKRVHFVTRYFPVTVQVFCRYCINFHKLELYQYSYSLRVGREQKRERPENRSFFTGEVEVEIEERLKPEKAADRACLSYDSGCLFGLYSLATRGQPESPLPAFSGKLEIGCDAAAHGNEVRPLFSRLIWARQAMMLRWPVMREPAGQDDSWYEYVYT